MFSRQSIPSFQHATEEGRRLAKWISDYFGFLQSKGALYLDQVSVPSGSWTPTDASGAVLSLTVTWAKYKYLPGGVVWLGAKLAYPATVDGSVAAIGGLPFVPSDQGSGGCGSDGTATWVLINTNSTLNPEPDGAGGLTNAALSGKTLWINATYQV